MATTAGARIIHGNGLGIYGAMNEGLNSASGRLVGVLNADDTLLPGALCRLLAAMQRSGRHWAVGTLRWVDQEGRRLGELRPPPSWLPAEVLATLPWGFIAHPSTYMSRELWREVGPLDVSLPVAADYDLLVRARGIAPFARVLQPTATFRRHGAQVSRHSPELVADVAEVQRRHGLQPPLATTFARNSLRAYVNLRNPRWALSKRTGP
jgi:GT2 family glycosyltransferase